MDSSNLPEPNRAFATLRRFVRKPAQVERCELCAATLTPSHQHLLELAHRKLVCACDACAILFSGQAGEGGVRYRRPSQRVRYLPDFHLTDTQWEELQIPISLAFLFYSSPAGRMVALYPSPGGATESLLKLETWEEIVSRNSTLARMEPDTEALLVKREGLAQGPHEYFLAPIDECYRLVGLIRSRWQGLSGGAEIWPEISRFFAELRRRSEPTGEPSGA
ncbi:MAG TPA: DUF5947 family protein [Blastocatellia bacterium]|nr:DUF5947 family protein [Blastocatellia bacterium]